MRLFNKIVEHIIIFLFSPPFVLLISAVTAVIAGLKAIVMVNQGRHSYADLFSICVGQGGSFVLFTVLNRSIKGSLVELLRQLPK